MPVTRPTSAARCIGLVCLVAGCGRVAFDRRGDAGPVSDASPDARVPSELYAITYPGQEVYRIDPTTLQPTLVRTICGNQGAIDFGELAWAADGTFLVTGYPQSVVYTVASDGGCSPIPIATPVRAIEMIPPTLLAAGDDGKLYQLSSAGQLTLIGSIGSPPSGDLVWTGSQLLMSVMGASDTLVRIDPATGAITGTVGDTSRPAVYGLAWLDNTLYAATGNGELLTLDPSTGAPLRSLVTAQKWGGLATR